MCWFCLWRNEVVHWIEFNRSWKNCIRLFVVNMWRQRNWAVCHEIKKESDLAFRHSFFLYVSIALRGEHWTENVAVSLNLSAIIPSIHCSSLLDVQGVSQNFLVADTPGFAGKLKVIHAVISLSQSVLHHQVLQKLCIVLCSVSYSSCEIQFRTKSFHLWLLC
jgi:hypothetical protein